MATDNKKLYRVVLTTHDVSSYERGVALAELTRTEFELVPVSGTELWQPKVNIYNANTGFRFALDLPRDAYGELRAQLEKFSVKNGWDATKKLLSHFLALAT